jgi:hypothetical protein
VLLVFLALLGIDSITSGGSTSYEANKVAVPIVKGLAVLLAWRAPTYHQRRFDLLRSKQSCRTYCKGLGGVVGLTGADLSPAAVRR